MTAPEPAPLRADNLLNTALLDAELPSPRFVDDAFLHWLYDLNPNGPAIQRGADDDGVRVAHYAMIPQHYRGPDGSVAAAFSLNAVVRSGTQRQGWFQKLGLEIYEEAEAAGWQFAVVKYLGWKTPGPLPVRVCVPLSTGAGVESHAVDDAFLTSAQFVRAVDNVDDYQVRTWVNSYDAEYLRWRLECPSTDYALHVTDDLVAVSTRDKRLGIPAAVILKLLPRGTPARPVSSDRIIAAACRFHRAPYAVYAGFNSQVTVHGVQPPRRLQPSPLHLILRSLSPRLQTSGLALDVFEFLDMDAY